MGPAGDAVPYKVIGHDNFSGHDKSAIASYRNLDVWREHWASRHHRPAPAACPEPDLSERMLVEVAVGETWTGSGVRLEITAVESSGRAVGVWATLHYPTGAATCDIGSPYVLLTTPVFDGGAYLWLSVMNGIHEVAPPAAP